MEITTEKIVPESKVKEYRLRTIAIMGGVCFFVGRACFVEGLEPAGAGLVAALAFYNVSGLGGMHKALIAGSVVVTVQSVWFLMEPGTARMGGILLGGLLTAVFFWSFEILLRLWSQRPAGVCGEVVLFSVTSVVMVMVMGTGLPWLFFPAAAVLAVFCGYVWGVAEGLVVGFTSGIMVLICGQEPLHVVWLLVAAAAAGLCKDSGRVAAGAAVALTAAGTGCFELMPGALLLAVLPGRVMVRAEILMRKYWVAGISEAEENLKELSVLFGSLDNPRCRFAHQFRAMSQLYGRRAVPEKRHRVRRQEAAAAGYAGSSERSGDCYQWETLADGSFVIALSDGMGKGGRAAAESSLAVTSVIKMMKAGLPAELVLKLLNAILMTDNGEERYSSMDLGVLDPESGEFHIYKTGAAPTIVKRGDDIEILRAQALPMGVREEAAVSCVSTLVRPGDQVIMITDGVVDSRRDDLELSWLVKALGRIKSRSPQTICDLIIREAAENYGSREKDDMTAVSFVVRQA